MVRPVVTALSALALLLSSCSGGDAGQPTPTPGSPVPGYTQPAITIVPVTPTSTPTPVPGTPTATPAPTIAMGGPIPDAAVQAIRDHLAGRGLTLAGACPAITSAPPEGAHCYLVLPGSTFEQIRLSVGPWASGHGITGLTLTREGPTYRITEVRQPTGTP